MSNESNDNENELANQNEEEGVVEMDTDKDENQDDVGLKTSSQKKNLVLSSSVHKSGSKSPERYASDDDDMVNIVQLDDKKATKRVTNALGDDAKLTSSKAITTELRNVFSKYLGKLNENSTLDVGFRELKATINKFNTQEALRVYIGSLSVLTKNSTHQAKEVQALLIGFIANKYKDELIDPLDKPGSILKTINRTLDILKNLMKENSFTVHKAIAHSYKDLLDKCMPKEKGEDITIIFLEPLFKTILSGVDKMAQIAGSIILSDLIEYLGDGGSQWNSLFQDILQSNKNKIVNTIVKSKCDSPQIFDCFFNLAKSLKFELLFENLPLIYEKIITILNSKAHFLTKNSCCKCLELIAISLLSLHELNTGNYQSEIIFSLEKLGADKNDKLRFNATRALKLWNKVEAKYNEALKRKEQEAEKMNKMDVSIAKNSSTSSSNNFNKLKMLRDLNKVSKSKERVNSAPDGDDQSEVYKKGIGSMVKISQMQTRKENAQKLQSGKVNPLNLVKESIKKVINSSIGKDTLSSKDSVQMGTSGGFINLIKQKIDETDRNLEEKEKIESDRADTKDKDSENKATDKFKKSMGNFFSSVDKSQVKKQKDVVNIDYSQSNVNMMMSQDSNLKQSGKVNSETKEKVNLKASSSSTNSPKKPMMNFFDSVENNKEVKKAMDIVDYEMVKEQNEEKVSHNKDKIFSPLEGKKSEITVANRSNNTRDHNINQHERERKANFFDSIEQVNERERPVINSSYNDKVNLSTSNRASNSGNLQRINNLIVSNVPLGIGNNIVEEVEETIPENSHDSEEEIKKPNIRDDDISMNYKEESFDPFALNLKNKTKASRQFDASEAIRVVDEANAQGQIRGNIDQSASISKFNPIVMSRDGSLGPKETQHYPVNNSLQTNQSKSNFNPIQTSQNHTLYNSNDKSQTYMATNYQQPSQVQPRESKMISTSQEKLFEIKLKISHELLNGFHNYCDEMYERINSKLSKLETKINNKEEEIKLKIKGFKKSKLNEAKKLKTSISDLRTTVTRQEQVIVSMRSSLAKESVDYSNNNLLSMSKSISVPKESLNLQNQFSFGNKQSQSYSKGGQGLNLAGSTNESGSYNRILTNIKKETELSHKYDNDPISIKVWKNALFDIEDHNINRAFERILESGDDLYLFRLLHLTGPVIEKLSLETGKNVMFRINAIARSHQIQSIILRWIKKAYENNLIQIMKTSEQNEFLETLYEFSFLESKVGQSAGIIYQKLTL